MCFLKNNHPKLVLFYLRPLEIVDQDPGNQVKNSVLKSRNRCNQVMITKSFWRMTRFWFSGPGHGQVRQNAPMVTHNLIKYSLKTVCSKLKSTSGNFFIQEQTDLLSGIRKNCINVYIYFSSDLFIC